MAKFPRWAKIGLGVAAVGGAGLLAWKFWPTPATGKGAPGARGGDGLNGATQNRDAENLGKGLDVAGKAIDFFGKLVGSRYGGSGQGGDAEKDDGTYEGTAPD